LQDKALKWMAGTFMEQEHPLVAAMKQRVRGRWVGGTRGEGRALTVSAG